MKVTVIVVSWNTHDILRQCLNLINSAAGKLEYETIVVDNGSIDGSTLMVTSFFPNVRLLKNDENLGFAKAVNQGIRASNSEYVALVNSDIMAEEKSLDYMVGYMEKNRKLAIVAPQLLSRDGKLEENRGYKPSPLFIWKQLAHKYTQRLISTLRKRKVRNEKAMPSDWLGASYMVIRREAIEEVGLFDEGIFMYGEDMEFCLRCRDRGWDIEFIPWVTSVHYGGGSSNEINEVKLLALVGTYRIAADRLSRLNYFMFGIMWTAVLVLKALNMGNLKKTSKKDEGRNFNTETRKVIIASFKLSISSRKYADKYFTELEKVFRKKLAEEFIDT